MNIQERLNLYKPVRHKPDLDRLSENESKILPLLLQAAEAMDMPYWIQEYGDPTPLLDSISDEITRKYLRINYGPWDRMHKDEPIIDGIGEKPSGANYYPADITREEFDAAAANNPAMKSPFTMIRRERDGGLIAIPYHEFFHEHVQQAADKLLEAAKLAESSDFQKFLNLRADALLTDDYRASDFAWMDLHDNSLELLIGPMEIMDQLFGIKTAYAASVFVKDKESGVRLSKYKKLLPRFQASLPVPDQYKAEVPGAESDLQVYDALHFSGLEGGDPPTGVAWPNDEQVQLQKGVRSMLIRNMMRAKFEAIHIPVSNLLIPKDQQLQVHFNARLDFVMFHELAHGLGINYTLDSQKLVREALGNLGHVVEEGKADLVGLFIATQLNSQGQITDEELLAIYVTSLVSLLDNCYGRQSVMRLNFFKEMGAYSRDKQTGTYRVHAEKMPKAIEKLTEKLLRLQGDGDYAGAAAFIDQHGQPDDELKIDMERMDSAGLPLGITLNQ
jgi:hypothetical protein